MDMLCKRMSVVILTHNRINELQRTLEHMLSLPEQPAIIVVDNASINDTPLHVRQCFPNVKLIRLQRNMGAAARNAGVAQARTPYIAFCDDDSWWAGGSLQNAAELLDSHPGVAALCARICSVLKKGKIRFAQ